MDLDFFTRNDVPYFNDPSTSVSKDDMQFVTNSAGSIDLVSGRLREIDMVVQGRLLGNLFFFVAF